MCVRIPEYMSVCHTCAGSVGSKKRLRGSLGIGVTSGCELPSGFWDLDLGLLQDQQELLTAEPSFQPQLLSSKWLF